MIKTLFSETHTHFGLLSTHWWYNRQIQYIYMSLGSAQYVCTTYQIFGVNSTEILLTITCLMLESNRILALIWLPISDSQRYFSYSVSDYEDSIIVSRKYFSQTHYQNTFCIIYLKLPFLYFNYTTPNHFSSLVLIIVSKEANIRIRNAWALQSCIFPFFLLIALASLKSVFHFNSLEWPHS